jgi:hypothetical protein
MAGNIPALMRRFTVTVEQPSSLAVSATLRSEFSASEESMVIAELRLQRIRAGCMRSYELLGSLAR